MLVQPMQNSKTTDLVYQNRVCALGRVLNTLDTGDTVHWRIVASACQKIDIYLNPKNK